MQCTVSTVMRSLEFYPIFIPYFFSTSFSEETYIVVCFVQKKCVRTCWQQSCFSVEVLGTWGWGLGGKSCVRVGFLLGQLFALLKFLILTITSCQCDSGTERISSVCIEGKGNEIILKIINVDTKHHSQLKGNIWQLILSQVEISMAWELDPGFPEGCVPPWKWLYILFLQSHKKETYKSRHLSILWENQVNELWQEFSIIQMWG